MKTILKVWVEVVVVWSKELVRKVKAINSSWIR